MEPNMQGIIREEILLFSKQQSEWCSDLIRRAVSQERVTPDDCKAVLNLLKAHVGIISDDGCTPEVLSEAHSSLSAAAAVWETILQSVSEVQNVNRLAADQELSFAPKGITVIYGDNGSGKSGYP
jgi:AAA15 family ATPase/GTPase